MKKRMFCLALVFMLLGSWAYAEETFIMAGYDSTQYRDWETNLFFEDKSGTIIKDDTLKLLISHPNVVLTSHQAFLTEEALQAIAAVTLENLDDFFAGKPLKNEVTID